MATRITSDESTSVPMLSDTRIIIKVQLGDDIRKVRRNMEDITLDELVLMVQRLYSLQPTDVIMLKYYDEEKDLITMVDNNDLTVALSCVHLTANVLKLRVLVNGRMESDISRDAIREELTDIRANCFGLLGKLLQLDTAIPDVKAANTKEDFDQKAAINNQGGDFTAAREAILNESDSKNEEHKDKTPQSDPEIGARLDVVEQTYPGALMQTNEELRSPSSANINSIEAKMASLAVNNPRPQSVSSQSSNVSMPISTSQPSNPKPDNSLQLPPNPSHGLAWTGSMFPPPQYGHHTQGPVPGAPQVFASPQGSMQMRPMYMPPTPYQQMPQQMPGSQSVRPNSGGLTSATSAPPMMPTPYQQMPQQMLPGSQPVRPNPGAPPMMPASQNYRYMANGARPPNVSYGYQNAQGQQQQQQK